MGIKQQILPLFSGKLYTALKNSDADFEELREIRLRVEQPVILQGKTGESYVKETGELTPNSKEGMKSELKELRDVVEHACGYSGYAFEEEMKRGYITVLGGHRIGLAGKAVLEGNAIQTLKYISGLNIRIARSVPGCAEVWKEFLYKENKPCHVLVISPPGCGKTTLLRDIVRMYSQGGEEQEPVAVGVVDERSEIAGACRGVAVFDLGPRTDVLDGCPKNLGMEMLIRSMSPRVVAVDEIGSSDVDALEQAVRCGCKIVATLHGYDLKDYMEKPGFDSLVKERVFDRYIFLKGGQMSGEIEKIYDKNFLKLWEGQTCT